MTASTSMLVIAGGLLGLILGSFLATLVIRWPEARSILAGRSACDACGQAMAPQDLVPILSALILRGRCRYCGAAIAPLHMATELTGAGIGAVSVAILPGLDGLALASMGWIALPLFLLDLRHHWLPRSLTLLLGATGLAFAGFVNGISLTDRIIAMGAGVAILWAVRRAYTALRGREGMGAGDPLLFGALGAWLGWQALAPLLFLASAGLLFFALLDGKGTAAARRLPLGAAMLVAGFVLLALQAGAIWPVFLTV